jgi:phage-related tail protein
MSANLVEKMVENATNVSMRKAAQNIKEMTNQDVSHIAAWNIVQELGQRIEKHEDEKIQQYEDFTLTFKASKPIE